MTETVAPDDAPGEKAEEQVVDLPVTPAEDVEHVPVEQQQIDVVQRSRRRRPASVWLQQREFPEGLPRWHDLQ